MFTILLLVYIIWSMQLKVYQQTLSAMLRVISFLWIVHFYFTILQNDLVNSSTMVGQEDNETFWNSSQESNSSSNSILNKTLSLIEILSTNVPSTLNKWTYAYSTTTLFGTDPSALETNKSISTNTTTASNNEQYTDIQQTSSDTGGTDSVTHTSYSDENLTSTESTFALSNTTEVLNNSASKQENKELPAQFNDTGLSRLSSDIASSYESVVRPMCPGQERVNVTVDLAIRQLIDLYEPEQTLELSVWFRMTWIDCNLNWDISEYNQSTIILPIDRIWKPDITLYESISEEFYGFEDFRADIFHTGRVAYNFPSKLEVLCELDVSKFPFDTQTCTLTFGSWASNGLEMDVDKRYDTVDLNAVEANAEWEILDCQLVRHVVMYGCCPEPFPDVTAYIRFKRRPEPYIVNIIIPSILITCVSILGFLLPVDSGEKTSLQLIVMLTISVFQMLVAENLPPSSDIQPLLITFMTFTLVLSGGAALMEVLVLNVHYRGHCEMSNIMKYYVLYPLSVITLVRIPGLSNYICKPKPDNQLIKIFNELAQRKYDNDKHVENSELWMYLAVVIDRIAIVIFSIVLLGGSIHIFGMMQ